MESSVKRLTTDIVINKKCDETNDKEKQIIHNYLTYDVLRIILQYLSAKDLLSAAIVCRSWRDAAKDEAVTRKAPVSLLKQFQLLDEDEVEGTYDGKCLGSDLRIKPSLALICAKDPNETEWKPKDCYCKNLPSNCTTAMLSGYDIVSDDLKIGNQQGLAACAFLPVIPNLKCKMYFKHSIVELGSKHINDHVNKLVKQLLPSKNQKSKCIILLTDPDDTFTKLFLHRLRTVYKPGTISFWGGVCVNLKICNKKLCMKAIDWAVISLSSPMMQTWSIVLLRSCSSEQQIRDKLENFRRGIKLKKHTIGLMFACCERKNKKEIETSTFKKIFPNVPLIGLHGYGEYGLNTLNKNRENQLQHAYSTIFLILTYQ